MDVLGGRYRLDELIGSGGMAVVWRAHDDVLGRPVAVKLLSSDLAKDASFRKLIQREARAAARLAHPHVGVVHDYGEWTDVDGAVRPYVVMELIDGPSLNEVLSAGQLPWYRAASICAQVADGLAAAHARGLVHHDIKPANIVLSTTGPKIVDFGISAIVGEQDQAGAVFGTPGFVAPERIVGRPIEPAADVYALGLTLYRCLAGRPPWRVATAEALLYAHVHTPPEPLPAQDAAGTEALIPRDLIDICDRCLSKDPAERPTAGELSEALAALPVPPAGRRRSPARPVPVTDDRALNVTAYLASASEATSAVAPEAAAGPGRRRDRRLIFAALAATLALLAVGVAVWVGVDRDGRPVVAAPATSGPPAVACTATYWVRSDNGSRFRGELLLANEGAVAITGDWNLTYRYPGSQHLDRLGGVRALTTASGRTAPTTPTSGPSAGWTQQGPDVSVYPARMNAKAATVDPQKQVTMAFEGSYQERNPMPGSFAVNGVPCQPVLVGPVDAPPPTRPDTGQSGPVGTTAPPSLLPSGTGRPIEPTNSPAGSDRPDPGGTTAAPPTTAVEVPESPAPPPGVGDLIDWILPDGD